MKAKAILCTVILISALLFVSGSGSVFAADISIDVNCTMKPGGSEEAAIKKFSEVLEQKSGGRMEVKIFMSGQLGNEKTVLELLKLGQAKMALTGGIFRTMFAKEYDPITIPFYLSDWDVVKAYLEGPMGAKLSQLALDKGGIINFGPQKRAAREMTTNKKIVTPDDIKGIKLRLPAIPGWVDLWKSLGALPVVVPAPEIYLALKTGQADCQENSLAAPYTRKLWEVQKYIIMTDHVYFPWHWVASASWFNGLSKEDQELIRQAVEEARAHGDKTEDEMNGFYRKELEKKGMIFVDPDKKAIRKAAMPAIKRAVAELDPAVAAEVEKLSN